MLASVLAAVPASEGAGQRWITRRHLLALGGIVALALALRLAWIVVMPSQPLRNDAPYYHGMGVLIAAGYGHVDVHRDEAGNPVFVPTAIHPPAYSYFVGG
jgi:hypothetical protein